MKTSLKEKFCRYLASLADKRGTIRKGAGLVESRLKIFPIEVVHNRFEDETGSIIYVKFLGTEIFGFDGQE